MEQKVRVVADSSCDLPLELVERFKIVIIPLIVRFGAEVYVDGELSTDEFWEKAAGPTPPHTSQPSIGAFQEQFARLVERGQQVICLTVTGKHSGTFNSARLAAQRFGETVKVFDSLSISLGTGIQALVAAQAAQAGHSLQEILAILEDLRAKMQLTLVLDTLENLQRGGRAAAFIAVVGRMAQALNIKPVINVVDGQLRLLGAARSLEAGLRRIRKRVERMAPLEYLAVVHTRCQLKAKEMADWLAERVNFPREQVMVRETGPVLATHAGPGVVGVLAVPAD